MKLEKKINIEKSTLILVLDEIEKYEELIVLARTNKDKDKLLVLESFLEMLKHEREKISYSLAKMKKKTVFGVKICECACHVEGTSIRHCWMNCCCLIHEKYIVKKYMINGVINRDLLAKVIRRNKKEFKKYKKFLINKKEIKKIDDLKFHVESEKIPNLNIADITKVQPLTAPSKYHFNAKHSYATSDLKEDEHAQEK